MGTGLRIGGWLLSLLLLGGTAVTADGNTGEDTGDVLRIAVPGAALLATLVHEDGHDGLFQLVLAIGASQIVTEGLKGAVDKTRPNGRGIDSFPSGHASAAFTGAGFFHRRYGWKTAIPAYAGAVFVAFSRMHGDKHYFEDVAAGAFIGVASSFIFARPHGVEVVPRVTDSGLGAVVSARW